MLKKNNNGEKMKIKAGDIVECIKHPKYSKEFEGQAQVTKVLEVPNGY